MHRHTSLGVPSSLLQAQTESPGTLVAENHCFKAKRIVLPLVKLSQQWRSRPLLDKRYKDPATFFFFPPFLRTDKSSAFISQISRCSLQFASKLSWASLLWTLYCVTCISVYPHFHLTCWQPAPSTEERQRLCFFFFYLDDWQTCDIESAPGCSRVSTCAHAK